MAKIVVALGGNALGKSPQEQLELVKNTAKSLVGLITKGHEIVISHGNGPQVGSINLDQHLLQIDNLFPVEYDVLLL